MVTLNNDLKRVLLSNGYKRYVERNDIAGINDACKRIKAHYEWMLKDLDPNDEDDNISIKSINSSMRIIVSYLEAI